MERTGLAEVALAGARTEAAKGKVLGGVLDILLETRPAVHSLVSREEAGEEAKEEGKMLEMLVQRVQFTLLSMNKLDTGKGKNKKDSLKNLQSPSIWARCYCCIWRS